MSLAPSPSPDSNGSPSDQFPATPWSVLLEEDSGGDPSNDAWERLARAYWKPLYAFLRRRGADHHSAADDTQGFFTHLLQRDTLRRVARGGGLFRSFLLTSLQNWRTDQHRAATAEKRGGDKKPLSYDELGEAGAMPVAESDSPEDAFDRSWARTVYQNAISRLGERLESRGRGAHFAKLCGVLTGEGTAKYQVIAQELGMKEGAVRETVSQLRKEFGQVLRDEVRLTVTSEDQVDDEIRHLIGLSQSA